MNESAFLLVWLTLILLLQLLRRFAASNSQASVVCCSMFPNDFRRRPWGSSTCIVTVVLQDTPGSGGGSSGFGGGLGGGGLSSSFDLSFPLSLRRAGTVSSRLLGLLNGPSSRLVLCSAPAKTWRTLSLPLTGEARQAVEFPMTAPMAIGRSP